MPDLIHDLLLQNAAKNPRRNALTYQSVRHDYGALSAQVLDCAAGLLRLELGRSERVAIYLEKRLETVAAIFGASSAGGVFGPGNPLVQTQQGAYIFKGCNVRIPVT